MRLDPTVTHARVFPLIDVSRDQLAEVVGGRIISAEPVDGGLTNTIHKVVTEANETFGVKHYAGGRDWFETELTTLTLLHRTLPVPEVVHVDDERFVIVYRWIEGMTLLDLRRKGNKEGVRVARRAARPRARVAREDRCDRAVRSDARCSRRATCGSPTGARARGWARRSPMRCKRELEAAEPMMAWGAVCLSHGDLSHRNVIVARRGGGWRINGIIDWETATTSSPLFDIGSLFRYGERHDAAFLHALRARLSRGRRRACPTRGTRGRASSIAST